MRYVKWTLISLIALLIFAVFHYTLPQHDVVRITSTEVIRTDFTAYNRMFYAQADSGSAETETRDIRLINAVYEGGGIMVFRNEDTGFGWPFYFKFDSANTQAEASDLESTRDAPQWVVVTHYGWRNEFLSIYPNAVGMRAVDSADVRIIPWVNIIILTTILLFLFWIRKIWRRFKLRRVDPAIEDASEAWDVVDAHADAAKDRARGFWGRISAWFGTWRSKPRR